MENNCRKYISTILTFTSMKDITTINEAKESESVIENQKYNKGIWLIKSRTNKKFDSSKCIKNN